MSASSGTGCAGESSIVSECGDAMKSPAVLQAAVHAGLTHTLRVALLANHVNDLLPVGYRIGPGLRRSRTQSAVHERRVIEPQPGMGQAYLGQAERFGIALVRSAAMVSVPSSLTFSIVS